MSGHIARAHEDPVGLLMQLYTDRRTPDECWPWIGALTRKGYAVVGIDYRQHRVARIVLGLDVDDPRQACHRCDNPPCVNPDHLFPASPAGNQHDKANKGRPARGETNGGGRKLTTEQVREIRRLVRGGETRTAVGERFGVTRTMVGMIVDRKKWSHVE